MTAYSAITACALPDTPAAVLARITPHMSAYRQQARHALKTAFSETSVERLCRLDKGPLRDRHGPCPSCRASKYKVCYRRWRRRSLCISSSLKNASAPGTQDRIVPFCAPQVAFIASSRSISRPSIARSSEITQTVRPAPFDWNRATSSAAVWATFGEIGCANLSCLVLRIKARTNSCS
jgi:hypothetical protein